MLVATMHAYCYLWSTVEGFGCGARFKWLVERCAFSRSDLLGFGIFWMAVVYVDQHGCD